MVVFHGCVKMVTFAHWAPKSSLITGDMIWCVCKNSTAWVVILQITMRRVQGYPSCQALMICNLLHGKSRKQTTFCCNGAVLTCCSTQTLHFKRPPLTPGWSQSFLATTTRWWLSKILFFAWPLSQLSLGLATLRGSCPVINLPILFGRKTLPWPPWPLKKQTFIITH